tara:strand:- start:6488 stop:8833 length:2346 start_codon:yes stop_codon:yes gene_type:complete
MARKDVVFGVGVDTGSSVSDVKGLDKELQQLNSSMVEMTNNGQENTQKFKDVAKAAESTKNEIKKLSGDMEHLGDVIGVEVSGSISKMEDRLYELALAGQTSSSEFVKLQEQTARYKKIIIETDRSVDALAEQGRRLSTALSISSATVAGFQGFTGVSALLGSENENLLKTITKLQAAQGVLNSIEQIKIQLDHNSIKLTKLRVFWQKALTLATGKGSTAMKLFRGALIATGIGALIVGVGLLIANFSKLSGWIKTGIAKFKEMGTGMKLLLYPITLLIAGYELIMGALQALGVIDSEETKKRKKNAEERIKSLEKEKEVIGERYDFEIAKAKAAGKDTFKLEQQKRHAFRKSTRLQIASIQKLAKLNKETTDEQKKEIAELTKLISDSEKETTIAVISNNKKKSDSSAKAHAERIAANKTASDKRIAQAQAEQDALNQILMDQAAVEDEIFKMRLSANDLEEQAVSEKFDALFLKAQGNAELEKQLMIQQESELGVLRKGFADKEAEDKATAIATSNALRHSLMRESNEEDLALLQEKYDAERLLLLEDQVLTAEEKIPLQNEILEREKAETDAINKKWSDKDLADAKKLADEKKAIQDSVVANVENGLNAMSSLNNLVTDMQLKKANGNADAEEKIRKASFKRQKALQLGMAVIDGFKAITSSLAQSPIAIGPIPNPAGIASLAFAGITSAVNIAKIASSKYEGGGSKPTTPTVPSLGGGAGAGASSFSIGDNTSSTQTNLNADGTQSGGSGQTQVVVVETDITTAVNNVAQIEEISTF